MAQIEEIIIDIFDGDVPVVGGDIGWNQLIQNGNFANSNGWTVNRATMSVADNKATLTMSAESGTSTYIGKSNVGVVADHIYLISAYITSSKATHMRFYLDGNYTSPSISIDAETRTKCVSILTKRTSGSALNIYVNSSAELEANDTVIVEDIQCFDLTQFGAAFAQSIQLLEQASTGAGIALFDALFPNEYYAYNAGEVKTIYLQ